MACSTRPWTPVESGTVALADIAASAAAAVVLEAIAAAPNGATPVVRQAWASRAGHAAADRVNVRTSASRAAARTAVANAVTSFREAAKLLARAQAHAAAACAGGQHALDAGRQAATQARGSAHASGSRVLSAAVEVPAVQKLSRRARDAAAAKRAEVLRARRRRLSAVLVLVAASVSALVVWRRRAAARTAELSPAAGYGVPGSAGSPLPAGALPAERRSGAGRGAPVSGDRRGPGRQHEQWRPELMGPPTGAHLGPEDPHPCALRLPELLPSKGCAPWTSPS